jgi:sulfate/thiosulfate transport system permease protein
LFTLVAKYLIERAERARGEVVAPRRPGH